MRLQGVMQPLKDNMKFKSITEKISEKTFPINIYGFFARLGRYKLKMGFLWNTIHIFDFRTSVSD